jgi:chloride channel 3/4/5
MGEPNSIVSCASVAFRNCNGLVQANGVRIFHTALVYMLICGMLRPRVILVEYHGSLAGLITVKDVLRFIVSSEHSHPTNDSVWNDPGGLDGLLEEAWLWTGNVWRRTYSAARRLVRR